MSRVIPLAVAFHRFHFSVGFGKGATEGDRWALTSALRAAAREGYIKLLVDSVPDSAYAFLASRRLTVELGIQDDPTSLSACETLRRWLLTQMEQVKL